MPQTLCPRCGGSKVVWTSGRCYELAIRWFLPIGARRDETGCFQIVCPKCDGSGTVLIDEEGDN